MSTGLALLHDHGGQLRGAGGPAPDARGGVPLWGLAGPPGGHHLSPPANAVLHMVRMEAPPPLDICCTLPQMLGSITAIMAPKAKSSSRFVIQFLKRLQRRQNRRLRVLLLVDVEAASHFPLAMSHDVCMSAMCFP